MNLLQRQPFATQVQRHALTGQRDFSGLILCVQTTHAHGFAERTEHQRIAHCNLPGHCRAGDNDTRAGHAERPIDRQPKTTLKTALRDFVLSLQQSLTQGVDALPGHARQFNLRRIGVGPGRQQCADLLAHLCHP
ncbi:hypothetical protein D3C71_715860 [compost metagenome]